MCRWPNTFLTLLFCSQQIHAAADGLLIESNTLKGCTPHEFPGGVSRGRSSSGDGWGVGSTSVPLWLRTVVSAPWPVCIVRPQSPARGEPRVHLQRWSGWRPGVSHLSAGAHQAAGHALRTHLLPGVSHQLPAGEWLLPRVPSASHAAELQETQPAGAQAAGQTDCGVSVHWTLHWNSAKRRTRGPHQEQVRLWQQLISTSWCLSCVFWWNCHSEVIHSQYATYCKSLP